MNTSNTHMSDIEKLQLEQNEQDVLLDVGRPFKIGRFTFTIRQAYLNTLDELDACYSRLYFDKSVFTEKADSLDIFNEQRRLVKPNTKICAKICAIAVLNNWILIRLFLPILAWYFHKTLTPQRLYALTGVAINASNLSDFTNSIAFLSLQPRMTTPQAMEA